SVFHYISMKNVAFLFGFFKIHLIITLRLYSLFSIHYSLFTILCSLFSILYSLFSILYSLFTIHYSLFNIPV
ncbi:MAG: hypothetical protein ACI30M_05025, partial [Muribaculaceae bacterium]